MIRCYNCQIKVLASMVKCPHCGRNPWILEPADIFAIGHGKLLRYNGFDKSVVVPDGVHVIGEMAFESTAVRSVILPMGVRSIEKGAFYSCMSLNYVEIPASITKIGPNAFGECPYLKSVTVSKTCKIADGAFMDQVEIHRI